MVIIAHEIGLAPFTNNYLFCPKIRELLANLY